jgi:hypothetical protein
MFAQQVISKVELARAIGTRYLDDHSDSIVNFFHTNQSTARKLTKLNDTLTDKQLEQALLALYFELPNCRGSLARDLRHFFVVHLKKHHLLVNYYSIKRINKIGKDYLQDHPEPGYGLCTHHTHQDEARKLQLYALPHAIDKIPLAEAINKQWLFIWDIYCGLTPGKISFAIEEILEDVFELDLSRDLVTQKQVMENRIKLAKEELPQPSNIQSFTPN